MQTKPAQRRPVGISLKRQVRAGTRVDRREGVYVLPVSASLSVEFWLRNVAQGGFALMTPLGVVAGAPDAKLWHGIPTRARTARGTLVTAFAGGSLRAGSKRHEQLEDVMTEDESTDQATETASTQNDAVDGEDFATLGKASGVDMIGRAMASVTSGEAAVGSAATNGDYTLVPLLETAFGGGFGIGRRSGTNPAKGGEHGSGGGGGGGGGSTRTVAVAIMGPNGVEVRPVVDVTKIGLAAIGVAVAVFGMALRQRKRR